MHPILSALVVAALVGGSAVAAAQPAADPAARPVPAAPGEVWLYHGPHPINADYGSGWCNLTRPHTHPYPPFDEQLFQENDDGYDFLGDPVDFGYTGDVFWYEGPHPIAPGWGDGWCYDEQPHRHIYRPWGTDFGNCGAHYCYYGPLDDEYWDGADDWAGYWEGPYAAYYRFGLYFQTRVPAPPRWGGGGRPGHGARGNPARRGGPAAGRPGGEARPVSAGRLPAARRPDRRVLEVSGRALPRAARAARSPAARAAAPPTARSTFAPVYRMATPAVGRVVMAAPPAPRVYFFPPAAPRTYHVAPSYQLPPPAPSAHSGHAAPSAGPRPTAGPGGGGGGGRRR